MEEMEYKCEVAEIKYELTIQKESNNVWKIHWIINSYTRKYEKNKRRFFKLYGT